MRKLFKHIGMICLALAVAVGSFFVPVGKSQNDNFASADSSSYNYYYEGSSMNFVFALPNSTSTYPALFKYYVSFSKSSSGLVFDFSNSAIALAIVTNSYSGSNVYTNSSLTSQQLTINNTGVYQLYTASDVFEFDIDDYSSDFNCNVYKIRLWSYPVYNTGTPSNPNNSVAYYYNCISYYDVNDNVVTISFYCLGGSAGYLNSFSDRYYYLDNPYSDNQLYQQGYNQGLIDNQQNIYDNGYSDGYDVGFGEGEDHGIVTSNNYSFLSLFGALFDAPITMLIGLLNFEFLGINLWAFVTSLFTLVLVLYIVKLVMGR